jgi:ribosome maturation factor RimP
LSSAQIFDFFCYTLDFLLEGSYIFFKKDPHLSLQPFQQDLYDRLAPVIQEAGYGLVSLQIKGDSATKRFEVAIEHLDDQPISLDDCVKIHHKIAPLLDEIIESAYVLEVSSVGVERPLLKQEDYERFQGRQARLILSQPLEDQTCFQGTLQGVESSCVLLREQAEIKRIPLQNIKKAHLTIDWTKK